MRTTLFTLTVASPGFPAFGWRRAIPILGAKVYRPVREPKELVQLAKSLRLNTIFAGDELAASEEFGQECGRQG